MKKRAKVIMLPNENGIIWSDVGPYDNELALVTKETEHLSGRPRHHLYITTDAEEDLRQAFYKGREQAKLPDETGTVFFIRPTFNGYLRELKGQQNPYEDWKTRSEAL